MSRQSRLVLKEAGAAFAVLAIYVLTLLTPLHQAAGLQRDLEKLGYETVGGWSLCVAPDETGDEQRTPSGLNCPVAGLGKQQIALSGPPPVPVDVVLVVTDILRPGSGDAPQSGEHTTQIWPRAPPAPV